MKVLVCGGRDFTDWPFFRDKMEEIALARFPRMDADEGKPDLVIAFLGGNGTNDMINRAKKADIEVIEVLK